MNNIGYSVPWGKIILPFHSFTNISNLFLFLKELIDRIVRDWDSRVKVVMECEYNCSPVSSDSQIVCTYGTNPGCSYCLIDFDMYRGMTGLSV